MGLNLYYNSGLFNSVGLFFFENTHEDQLDLIIEKEPAPEIQMQRHRQIGICKMKNNTIHIRALSPDNDHMIRKLIEMYQRCYNRFYPVESVYDIHYWKTHIGRRLISLIATNEDDQLLAHLALCPDARQPDNQETTHIQVLYIAYDPALAQSTLFSKISNAYKKQLHDLALRQQWDMFYCFSPIISNITENIDQVLLRDCDFIQTANMPAYFRVEKSEGPTHTDLFYDCNLSIMIPSIESRDKEVLLHLPLSDEDAVFSCAKALGLNRSSSEEDATHYALPSDTTSLMTHSFRTIDVSHSFLSPSLLHDTELVARKLSKNASERSQTLFVDIEDPQAENCIIKLKQHGFITSGYFPFAHGRDNLVLSKSIKDARKEEESRYQNFAGSRTAYTVHSDASHLGHPESVPAELAVRHLEKNEH